MPPSLRKKPRARGRRPGLGIRRRLDVSLRLGTIAALGAGCFGGPAAVDLSSFSEPELEAHISRIERQIDADHAALEVLVARPRSEADAALHDDADLREIAGRISRHVSELERLRAEQAGR